MSTEPNSNDTSASPSDEAKKSPSAEPTHEHASEQTAPAQAASSGSAEKSGESAHSSPDVADGDDGDGDDAEGEGTGEAKAEGAAEGAPAADGEKKKRRRRRRRKKTGAAAGADGGAPGAEGAAASGEGGAPLAEGEVAADGTAKPDDARRDHAGKDERKDGRKDGRRERKEPREERERPAFNLGDVVFGKVIEFTEDVIFIDLSSKAKAIFDLRELLITDDDDANTPDEPEEHEGDEHAAEHAEEAHADGEAAPAATAANAETASTEAPNAAAEVSAEVSAPPPEAAKVEAAPAQEAEAKAEPPPQPQLPRVILEPGAPFVGVVHNDGGRGGLVVLTHHPKRARRAKPVVSAAFRDKTLVWGIITGVIKGGVEVDVDGLRAFAPGSHMDMRLGADLHHLVGKRLPFAVTQYGKRGHNVVLSRRAMLEEHAKVEREEALKNLQIGAVVEGTVRTVVQFGAFIDVGGVEGLVPLSEMSHNRGDTPRDIFTVGEKVPVKILRVDEKGKLWLSRRSALADPWDAVKEKYAPGTKHTGKVARLQPFGAFIELESGVDGLIHTVDLSVKRIEHPSEVVKVGDSIDVVVASVDPSHHRIALHPAPTGDTSGETPQRAQLHKIVKVAVVSIEASGLVVRVLGATGRGARGFITSAGTGSPKGAELRKLFPVGKELDAKVIEMDPRRGDIRLSIKAVNEDSERNAFQQYRAQVKREAKFGTFADLLKKVNVPKE